MHERRIAAFLPDGDGEAVPSVVDGITYPIHPLQVAAMGMLVSDSLQFEELAAAVRGGGSVRVHGRRPAAAAAGRHRLAVEPDRDLLRGGHDGSEAERAGADRPARPAAADLADRRRVPRPAEDDGAVHEAARLGPMERLPARAAAAARHRVAREADRVHDARRRDARRRHGLRAAAAARGAEHLQGVARAARRGAPPRRRDAPRLRRVDAS